MIELDTEGTNEDEIKTPMLAAQPQNTPSNSGIKRSKEMIDVSHPRKYNMVDLNQRVAMLAGIIDANSKLSDMLNRNLKEAASMLEMNGDRKIDEDEED